jgi:predicted lipoprotein with Yx(FWY)xxD motif
LPDVNPSRLGSTLGWVGAILAIALAFAGQAGAAVSTIGQLAPDPTTQEYHPPYEIGGYMYPGYYTTVYHPPAAQCSTPQDYLQSTGSSPAAYVVPANAEKITAWSTNAAVGAGQEMTFKVFRQVGATTSYEAIGHDGPRSLTAAASANGHGKVNSFTGLSIPVQPGDIIGLFPKNADTVPDACTFEAGGNYMFSSPPLADSSSGAFTSASGKRLNLTATVQLTPAAGAHTLTVTNAGTGSGTVQSSPAGIEACASSCAHAFSDGTAVTLTATPDGYSTFAGWSGGGCTGTGACQLTVNADTGVTATFNTAGGGGYGTYEYPAYPPAGENAGGNPQTSTPKCKKSKRRRHRCAKRTRVVAKRAHNANLGTEILTTKRGRTLYSLSAEGGGTFICTGGCLSIWHPLTIPAGIRPLGPVRLGTVKRPEGSTQVTYHGRPLYTFTEDAAPGDAHGEGIKDVGTWGAVVVPPPKR